MSDFNVKFIKVKGYNFTCPLVTGEGNSRIVAILETLPYKKEDCNPLLGGDYGHVMNNMVEYACKFAKKDVGKILFICAESSRDNPVSKRHIDRIVNKFKATQVVIFGTKTLHKWTQQYKESTINLMVGRLLPISYGSNTVDTLFTFNLNSIATGDPKWFKSTVNLVGFASRHLATAIIGKNKFNLDAKPFNTKKTGITTVKGVRDFFKQAQDKPWTCFDVETDNLNRVRKNRLLTMQFALDTDVGAVIPVAHPQTPFSPSEINKIRDMTADFFLNYKPEYLVGHFIKFDLLQIAAFIGTKFFKFPVFDTAVGEYFLDENRKFFRLAGVNRGYALEALCAQQGGMAYTKDLVGKEDRANLANIALKKVAQYGVKDVIYPARMHLNQIQEAKDRGYKNYLKGVLSLGSDMISVFTEMEATGSHVDADYLTRLLINGSEFQQKLKQQRETFRESKNVRRLNKALVAEAGLGQAKKGLFGDVTPPWLFDPGKPKHVERLFFDVKKLKVINVNKKGQGRVDKVFLKEYKDDPDVSNLDKFRKLEKLKSTYIIGIYKKVKSEESIHDNRLRASYDFISILTTRTSSHDPNLQAIPSHGENAHIIKRQFTAEKNRIIGKADYNAHEVRGWANISNDDKLIKAFSKGTLLRRLIRRLFLENPDLPKLFKKWSSKSGWEKAKSFQEMEDIKKNAHVKSNAIATLISYLIDLEKDGDIHKKNYEFFFGIPAYEVTKKQRQGVKQVVFGVMYGKGAFALALDIFEDEFKELGHKYQMYSDEWMEAGNEYFEKAQELIDKLFSTFVSGGSWLKNIQKESRKTYTTESPFGATRHLFAYMHHDKKVWKMMDRRGPNSIIQGFSSNILYTAAREMQHVKIDLREANFNLEHWLTNIVHDSMENEFGLVKLPIGLYYLEHCMTTRAHDRCINDYGFNIPIQLEVEIELGPTQAHLEKWDFTGGKLLEICRDTINFQNEALNYGINLEKTMRKIEHNMDIVNKFRLKEIVKQGNNIEGATYMAMTPEKCLQQEWAL